MRIYCLPTRIFNGIAVTMALFVLSNPAHAVSFIYNKPAYVIIKAGSPCFYVDSEEDNTSLRIGVDRLFNSGKYTTPIRWQFQGRSGVVPNKKAKCLKYGVLPEGKFTVMDEAKPLSYNIPYLILLNVNGTLHGIKFCMIKENNGDIKLVETGSSRDAQCSNKPIVEKD